LPDNLYYRTPHDVTLFYCSPRKTMRVSIFPFKFPFDRYKAIATQ